MEDHCGCVRHVALEKMTAEVFLTMTTSIVPYKNIFRHVLEECISSRSRYFS